MSYSSSAYVSQLSDAELGRLLHDRSVACGPIVRKHHVFLLAL